MIVNLYLQYDVNNLQKKLLNYKEQKKEEQLKYYDIYNLPEEFQDNYSFTIVYSTNVRIWFSACFDVSEDRKRIFKENNIKNPESYCSSLWVNICREGDELGYNYLEEVASYLGGNYLAVNKDLTVVFDLRTLKTITSLS